MNTLLRRLRIENKEFVTTDELKAYCKSMKLNHPTVLRYFAMRGYVLRVFRGIYYVRTVEELELGRSRYNHLELVAKGLGLKDVKNWYFGLHTALKLNNMTHENFTVEDVINDKLFRAKPIIIAGYRFKFTKVLPSMITFGVKKDGTIRYSDPEKTILDFMYLWKYNGLPEGKILADVSGWMGSVSRNRLVHYSKEYPKTIGRLAGRVE
jgi:predicted transcriptional regulator of viral defense system